MCLVGWVWNWGVNSGSQCWSAVSYLWDSGVLCAAQIVRPGLAMRHSQNKKKKSHVFGEVQNKAVLKKKAKVFFCPVFAKCIYTWSTWLPLVQTSLGSISHLSWSQAKKKKPWRFHPHP